MGSWILMRNLICCSSSEIENQYFNTIIPDRTNIRSNSGTSLKNSSTCCSLANPITLSTPARLYHERSNKTISPPAGRWGTNLWKYHCDFSLSVGAGRATTRATRGSILCVIRLITLPLPAPSRPSQIITSFEPVSLTQSCNLISST